MKDMNKAFAPTQRYFSNSCLAGLGVDAGWMPSLRAIYLLGGMYDLRPMLCIATPNWLGFDEAEADTPSPALRLTHAPKDCSFPALPALRVAVDVRESTVFIRRAKVLLCSLARRGCSELAVNSDEAHAGEEMEFNLPDSASRAFALNLLTKIFSP